MKKIVTLFTLLTGATAANSQCNLFYDGFETGSYSPNWTVNGQTPTVTTTSPQSGLYRLEISGGTLTHLGGVSHTMTACTPSQISWWIYPQGNVSTNYFVAGNASVSATNCAVFCYWIGSSASIRFVSSVSLDVPETANQWYHIEMRNINWTNHTFDIYINNSLQATAFPFRSATQNNLTTIHLYNYNSGVGTYDDIQVGNASPSASSVLTLPLCNGNSNGSIDLSVSGGTTPYTFAWSNSATTEDINSLSAGTYSVTITDALGCTVSHSVSVTEPSLLTVATSQTDVTCFGSANGGATASVSGGTPTYTYAWNPPGGTNPVATGLAAGSYTCTVTDANGCTATQSVNITEPTQLLSAAANNGNICSGDTATLIGTATGGTPGYTYDWMPGGMSGSVATDMPSSTTTYTLLVTDANGCTSTASTAVTVNPLPVVNLGSDFTSCGTAMLDAGNAGSMYSWSDGSTTQMISASSTGSYDVMVTDANGCMGSDTINVTINQLPMVVGSASMNFACVGEPTINLFGSPADGTWSGPGVFGNTFEPDTAGVGNHDLIYTYTDSVGCTGIDTIQISVNLCTGIGNSVASQYFIYPNPNNGTFNVQTPVDVTELLISIYDVQGREVYQSLRNNISAGSPQTVDLNEQPAGVYVMQLRSGDEISTYRITLTK